MFLKQSTKKKESRLRETRNAYYFWSERMYPKWEYFKVQNIEKQNKLSNACMHVCRKSVSVCAASSRHCISWPDQGRMVHLEACTTTTKNGMIVPPPRPRTLKRITCTPNHNNITVIPTCAFVDSLENEVTEVVDNNFRAPESLDIDHHHHHQTRGQVKQSSSLMDCLATGLG